MIEMAEIFGRYGPEYREKFGERMPLRHRQAMAAIEQCRTEALGGHVYHCEACDEALYSYHSCKNRHCPKCQNETAEQWLVEQRELLLPTPYFMVTFTLPADGQSSIPEPSFALPQVRQGHALGRNAPAQTPPPSLSTVSIALIDPDGVHVPQRQRLRHA